MATSLRNSWFIMISILIHLLLNRFYNALLPKEKPDPPKNDQWLRLTKFRETVFGCAPRVPYTRGKIFISRNLPILLSYSRFSEESAGFLEIQCKIPDQQNPIGIDHRSVDSDQSVRQTLRIIFRHIRFLFRIPSIP